MNLNLHRFVILMAFATPAEAHQPYESNTRVLFERDRMEVCVTTSVEIAAKLLGGTTLNDSTVEAQRPQLRGIGAGLYDVTTDGKPVEAEQVFFSLRNEDAIFSVIYPLERGAEASFRARYLEKLPPGYSGSIQVLDETETSLGSKSLITREPSGISLSLRVPPLQADPPSGQNHDKSEIATRVPPPSTVKASGHDTGTQGRSRAMLIGVIFGLPILAAGAGCFLFWNRKSKTHRSTC